MLWEYSALQRKKSVKERERECDAPGIKLLRSSSVVQFIHRSFKCEETDTEQMLQASVCVNAILLTFFRTAV